MEFREEQSKWEERRISDVIRKIDLNQFIPNIDFVTF